MQENNPQYIDNRPIDEDQFEGKSHQSISKSIGSHIKDDNNLLRVIGLEGKWGCGKSTIIKLLEKELSKTHHIYVYDTWGHQEDSQRRAFLEELTDDLINNDILTGKTNHRNLAGNTKKISWRDKIKYLLARKRETNKKKIPELSKGFIILILVFILTPTFSIVSDVLFNQETVWWIRIMLPLSPIFISILIYLISSLFNERLHSISELFFIFKGKELENTTYEIFTDLEPSVKEFKDWIISISKGLTDKRLIIVYDNMDRLPPDKVKKIWSSIHTFFAEENYDNVDVIIPFDRKHLENTFEKDGTIDDFINKTFSIIYRVTPPVLTDWKKYFQLKYKEAFKQNEDIEYSIVLSVFDRIKNKFTPRDIIIFINELVAYKRIWKDKIPLRYMSIFCLKRDFILEYPQSRILGDDYLDQVKDLFTEDESLQSYMSALAFNVPVEKASEVLLVRDIEITLKGEGSITLNELSRNPNFIEFLEEVFKSSEIIINKAIPILSELETKKLKGNHIEKRMVQIWDNIVAKQCDIHIEDLTFNNNHKLLIINSSSGNKNKFIKYLIEQFNDYSEIDGKEYFNAFNDLNRFLKNNNIDFKINNFINKRYVSPKIFIDYLSVAKSDYKKYKLISKPDKLDDHISSMISQNSENIEKNVDFSHIVEEYSFDETKDNIETIINENKLTENNYFKILSIYKSITIEKPLDVNIKLNNLINLLSNVDKEDDGYYDLVALRLSYNEDYTNKSRNMGHPDILNDELSNVDVNFIIEISKRIEYYINYGDLLKLSTKWNNPLLVEVCKNLAENSYGTQKLDICEILSQFEIISSSIKIDKKKLLKSLNGWSKDAKTEITADNIEKIIPDFNFFEHSSSISLKLTMHINSVAKKYIESVDENYLTDGWNQNDSYIYNTLYYLMKNNSIKKIPDNIFRTVKSILKDISEKQIEIPENESKWSYFIKMSEYDEIKPTVMDIRDYFIREGNITTSLFIFFENLFRNYGYLEKKSSDTTRTILAKIVSDNDCFNIILNHKDFYSSIINNSGDDASDFKENIKTRLNGEDEINELIKFANQIGVYTDKDETNDNV